MLPHFVVISDQALNRSKHGKMESTCFKAGTPLGRLLAGYYGFFANISFTFEAIRKRLLIPHKKKMIFW